MVWVTRSVIFSLIILYGLLSGTALNAEEPRVYPSNRSQVFLGLDDTSSLNQVQDGRARDLQNVILGISADIRQRYGISLPVTAGEDRLTEGDTFDIPDSDPCAVTGVQYVKFSSGTERIVGTCGTQFRYLNGTSSWDVVDPDSVAITSGQDNQFRWTIALDNLIGTNDVNAPLRYDGSSLSHVSFSGLSSDEVPSVAKNVIFFKNYLIFLNTVENSVERPTRFRWSNVGTIDTWSDNNFTDIGALGGQEINCVGELYDSLIVGLDESLYRINLVGGDSTFNVSKITDSDGCIAKNSMRTITLSNNQTGLIFLDRDKEINFYNGVIVQSVSDLIDGAMNGLSASRLQYAVSGVTPTDYWICASNGSSSTNDLCLDFQYKIGEWTKHTNIPANAMANVIDNNGDDQVYWGSYKGFIYQLEDTSNTDDVATAQGQVSSVSFIDTATASGLQVIYNSSANYTTGIMVGAPIEIVGGTGLGETNTVVDNTITGIVVESAFSDTPDTTTTFEVGAIDSYYTTKWYSFNDPARIKQFAELYMWAEADSTSTNDISYANDFGSNIETIPTQFSSSNTTALWDTAVWDTAVWGDVEDVFKNIKLQSEGRYISVEFAEDDPEETFHYYGWNIFYWPGEVH